MATLDNANPTVLSASELPTRQKTIAPRLGPEFAFRHLIFQKPAYLAEESSWPGFAVEDEFAPDAIDEQEIYGARY